MGLWIVIAIVLFVLGSVMALKPSSIELRLDKLRMTARRLQLNPKVIACPDWIRGKDNEFGRGMIGQYALIVDGLKLPETRYQVIDQQLRPDGSVLTSVIAQSVSASLTSLPTADYTLDGTPLNLPDAMQPLIKAVYTKSNSLVVFWEDSKYVQPISNPNYKTEHIEPDLTVLKQQMQLWAQKLAASTANR